MFRAHATSGPMPRRSTTPGRNTSNTASARVGEPQERLDAGRLLEVEADRVPSTRYIAFVAGEDVSIAAHRVDTVDAQHLGAEVGEEHPAERARPEAEQLDDAHPGQRAAPIACSVGGWPVAHASAGPTAGSVSVRAAMKRPSASAVTSPSAETVANVRILRPSTRSSRLS